MTSVPESSSATAASHGDGHGDTTKVNMQQHRVDEDDYDYDYQYDEDEEEEEEEEVVMDEEEMLQMLDQMEPPLSVCQRLFKDEDRDAEEKEDEEKGDGASWLVLSASQRSSLRQSGFVVLDALAPASLAAEAYAEATARAASGSLAPAHGGGRSTTSDTTVSPSNDDTSEKHGPNDDEEQSGGQHASTASPPPPPPPPPQVTGYVGSVRDDLTSFVSAEREAAAAACGDGGGVAVSQALAILARLGEDLGRMVRLKGRVEHQLAVYPAGIGARYERHRDAYPADGCDDDDDEEDEDGSTAGAEGGEGKGGSGSSSVSFRRVTAICYLRGSGSPWQEQDGGALRLYPPAASKTHRDVSSSDSRVVFKFASQLGLSDEGNPQEQPQELQQQQPALNSGGCCDGGEGEGNEESNPTPAPPCGDGGGRGGDAGGAGGEMGDRGDGERQAFVDVAPLAGRAVVFLSGAVEHEVLPVTGTLPRAALTTWFH